MTKRCRECGDPVDPALAVPCFNCVYCFDCGQSDDGRPILCPSCAEALKPGMPSADEEQDAMDREGTSRE
jgi:hypothetical protein